MIGAMCLIGCKEEAKETHFSHDKVSFTVPKNWKISEQSPVENEAGSYYVSIEKEGLDESAMQEVTWFLGEQDLQYWMEMVKEELKKNTLLKAANISFSNISEGRFGKYNALIMNYNFSLLDIPHKGKIIAFSEGGKSFCFIQQWAVEDEKGEEFTKIEQTFDVKP